MSDLLVLHDLGDPAGGGPWTEAFSAAGWGGQVSAPDLPGHAGAPPPLGGSYHVSDPAVTAAVLLARPGGPGDAPVVVGVGASGWAALLLALASRAKRLVLVNALGGPWLEAEEMVASERQWLRALAEDPEAVAAPPPGAGLDPRLRHGVPPQADREVALAAAAALPVPVLVVEARPPGSGPLSPEQSGEVIASFPRADVVHLDGDAPARVAEVVVAWALTS